MINYDKPLKINMAMCVKCQDIITSEHRQDFKWCRCRTIAVDGGLDYIRRIGNPEDIIEMSESADEVKG